MANALPLSFDPFTHSWPLLVPTGSPATQVGSLRIQRGNLSLDAVAASREGLVGTRRRVARGSVTHHLVSWGDPAPTGLLNRNARHSCLYTAVPHPGV